MKHVVLQVCSGKNSWQLWRNAVSVKRTELWLLLCFLKSADVATILIQTESKSSSVVDVHLIIILFKVHFIRYLDIAQLVISKMFGNHSQLLPLQIIV